ncbi:MAG: hypothetical protein ACR2FP_05405 [Nocardioidaceae bacterium]
MSCVPSPLRGRASAAASLVIVLLAGCTHSDEAPPGSDKPTPAATSSTVVTPEPPNWVVTVGDSYISGEGARWAGNTSRRAAPVDALGPTAYDDRPGEESQPGCHRAQESIATLDLPNVRGKNLACSGATTRSSGGPAGLGFEPGLDFYRDGEGNRGQALALQRFARTHDVSHVIVSIGGNDFGFGPVVAGCALGFLGLFAPRQPCSADSDVTARFGAQQARKVRDKVRRAFDRVTTAMSLAGYADGDYRLVVLSYPSPLPESTKVRYARDHARYDVGGCPFFDVDLDWANDVALAAINTSLNRAARAVTGPDVVQLDLAGAFNGHRLCERGVASFPESGLGSWESAGAASRLEWVNRTYFSLTPWQVQESLHPNYWGMRAEQSCVELVIAAQPVAGRVGCRPGAGLTTAGTPAMRLTR